MPNANSKNNKLASKSFVKKAISQAKERKMFQTDSGGAIGTAGAIQELMDVGTGDTYLTRDGNNVTIKAIKLLARYNVNAAGDNATIRLILFRWMQDDTPTSADVLQDTGTRPNLSQTDFNNQGKNLHIVYDRLLSMDTVGKPYGVVKWNKFYKSGPKVRYISTGTSGMGKLYLFIRSDDNTNQPNIDYKVQVEFLE